MGPQVRSVRLKYLNPAGTWPSGNPRLYFRRPGGKNEPLPDAPIGSAKFLAAYAKLAGIDASRLPVKGSLSMAVDDFLRSDSFRKMAKGTQAYVRRTALAYLRQALRSRPGKHLVWNVTAYGKARSEKAASQWFAAACRAAGVAKTAHGLRKYRGAILSETGATLTQRKNWLGHRTEAESDHYAQSASAAKIMLGGG